MSEEFEVRGAHEDRMDEAAEREPRGKNWPRKSEQRDKCGNCS